MYKLKKDKHLDECDIITEAEQENSTVERLRKLCEAEAYEIWQARWDEGEHGRVTHRFIGDVRFVGQCRKFEFGLKVGFILTGQGTLNEWLTERRLADNPECVCGAGNESWVHVLCECRMYEGFRDLEQMGIVENNAGDENVRWNVRGVVQNELTYRSFQRFVERAYEVRTREILRVEMERIDE
ncbi:hypothetical protein TKK_0011664 [Trichogramma kaykai]